MGYIETSHPPPYLNLQTGLITIWDILKPINKIFSHRHAKFNNNMGYIETPESFAIAPVEYV